MTARLYTTVDVAKVCKVSLRTVIRWVDDGKLASFRTPGGHRRIKEEDLTKFLEHYQIPFPVESKGQGKKILVVEEKKVLERLLRQILRRSSDIYELVFTRDLYEASIRAGLLRPDLIIIGDKPKGRAVTRFCQALRKIPETKGSKILILSSTPTRLNLKGASAVDVHTVVNRSFTIEDLRPHLLEMLNEALPVTA